jgi:tetratricopeptide (TPR) repeat protein
MQSMSDKLKEFMPGKIYSFMSVPDFRQAISEAKEEQEQNTLVVFSLFDHGRLQEYLDLLKKGYGLIESKDYPAAILLFTNLIAANPKYPDAYLGLGLAYAETDQLAPGIDCYNHVLRVCPEHTEALLQRARLQRAVNKACAPGSPRYDEEFILNNLKKVATLKKAQALFISGYHKRLHHYLKGLPLSIPTILAHSSLPEDFNFANSSLTNGGVVDVLHGMEVDMADPEVSKYYFEKALLKFEHDCIAITKRAYHHFIDGNRKRAIIALTYCIEKYNYIESYFYRAKIFYDGKEYDLAKKDILRYITMLNLNDLESFKLETNELLSILFVIDKDLPSVDHEALTIKARAAYEQHNYLSAMKDISLAILLAPMEFFSEYYYLRSCVNLSLGAYIQAQYDVTFACRALPDHSQLEKLTAINTINNKFAHECLNVGKGFFEKGDFEAAKKIFFAGFHKKLMPELYHYYALTLIELKDQHESVIEYLNKASDASLLNPSLMAQIQKTIRNYHKLLNTLEYNRNKATKAKQVVTRIETPAIAIEVEKKKKKRTQKSSPMLSTPKKNPAGNSTSTIKSILNENKQAEKEVIAFMQAEAEEKKITAQKVEAEHKQLEVERKQRESEKKQRQKLNKAEERRSRNLQRQTSALVTVEEEKPEHIPSSLVNQSIYTIPEKTTIEAEIHVELTDLEKEVFKLVDIINPETGKPYPVYLVGGTAYDRVCEKLGKKRVTMGRTDLDYVTSVPEEKLIALGLKRIMEVNGLYVITINNVKIDISFFADLQKLSKEVSRRDFFSFYIDKDGLVHEPTGFGVANLLKGELKPILPASLAFKVDPLRIFRAFYQSSERNLKINSLYSHMRADKSLLIPAYNTENNLFHPCRFNSFILKALRGGNTSKNYLRMNTVGIIEVLFPHIYAYLKEDQEWFLQQFRETDLCPYPSLLVIYTNLITSAIMHISRKTTGQTKHINPVLYAEQLEKSLLFNEAFKTVVVLQRYLVRSQDSWNLFQKKLMQETRCSETTAENQPLKSLRKP